MLQATVCGDGLGPVEVDVGWGQIVDAFMIAVVIIVLDEGADLPLEIARQVVVVDQSAILQGLMPAFDLALDLGMIRRTAHGLHAFALEPLGQVVCHVTRSVVAEKPRPLLSIEVVQA